MQPEPVGNAGGTVEDLDLDFATKDQSMWGIGEPTLPQLTKTLLEGSLSGSLSRTIGQYGASIYGATSDKLDLTLAGSTGSVNVDYPVDGNIGLPTSVIAGGRFSVLTDESGTGSLSLDTHFGAGLGQISLENELTAELAGSESARRWGRIPGVAQSKENGHCRR